jgi:serine/threonine-protein kinase
MSPDPQTAYERLSPEEAAQIDAVCDRFERAWKETKAGGPVPRLENYIGQCGEPARTALVRELAALALACRERYGIKIRPEDYLESGAANEDPVGVATYELRLPKQRVSPGTANEDPVGSTMCPTPPVHAPSWPRLPGLVLIEVLGSGGMGVVFKARQVALGRDVAVKLLRDAHLDCSGHRERFLQEARAVARLQHPHLVQVYDFGEVSEVDGATSRPYLVMEYVAGGSLADRLRGPPLPPADVARLVETLAEAIHYAHQQGVVHRDLKPANILLVGHRESEVGSGETGEETRDPRLTTPRPLLPFPKITDFGLAKFLSGSALTHTGDVIGTPGYMAPEQAAGRPGAVTAAVDVYGLGAILYEALTGRPPFLAETTEATLLQVKAEDPVPPRRLQPTVPRDLNTICMKCLRKEPGRRYATAQDLSDDLRRFRAGEPIRARPVGDWERAVRWCRREPALASALAALVVVFLAGLSGVLWQWQSARHHAAKSEQNADNYRRERDAVLREQDRAELHLREALKRVDRLTQVGRDLLQRPGLYKLGKEVMDDALSYYVVILPQEGDDPRLRLEAARLYHQVGHIQHSLGRWAKAFEAYRQEARLLAGLSAAEPANLGLRHELALSYRWRGNALRDLGRPGEAREAYGQAVGLHEQLLLDSPGDVGYKGSLANTLLNLATVLSPRDEAGVLKELHERTLELNRVIVGAAPDDESYQAELALALESQGSFFLETKQVALAEDALRQALAIRQELFASGRLGRSNDRYLARVYSNLGRALAAAGQMEEAERTYREAVKLLEPLAKDFPDSPYPRMVLAGALGGLADLLKSRDRQREVEELRRQVLHHYEILTKDFPEVPGNQRNLERSHALLGIRLIETGRCADGIAQFRLGLKADPASAVAHNDLAWCLATAAEPGLRDTGEAVRLAQKAVAAEPKVRNFRNTLGVAHYYHGDDKEALAELEESMRLHSGGDSYDWFFLAMAHWRRGHSDEARAWFDRAVKWMDKHQPHNNELRRFRSEAETMLGGAGKH